MFSIPVAGLAKTAIAVTISLHPAQQIAVAQRVLASQGIGAWPVCGASG
jgi:hypothetical protein